MNSTTLRKLRDLGACPEAVEWAATQPNLAAAWRTCEDASWMLWLVGRLSGPPESASRKKLVLAACACARTALQYMPQGERRPLKAIQTAEAWARGKRGVTLEMVLAAEAAAWAAWAAEAAWAARAAAWAARAAAWAAEAAGAAGAAGAAVAAAEKKALRRMAAIVRRHYPTPPRLVTR